MNIDDLIFIPQLEAMRIKQGTLLPTTGIGTGYILLIIYGLMMYHGGVKNTLSTPVAYILPFVFSVMQFTYKDFKIEASNEEYIHVYRYFFIPFYTKVYRWTDFNMFVLKTLNIRYNVARGGSGMLSSSHLESKLVIVGKSEKLKEPLLICSGTKNQLDKLIKEQICSKGIPIYLGAPKKGYEYEPE